MQVNALPTTIKTVPPAPLEPAKAPEWNPSKRWNPFNSYKLLTHVGRWKYIKRGRAIPPPVLVTVDPTNICNFNCVWCNAEFVRQQRHRSLSAHTMNNLADFLANWGYRSGSENFGVEAVCVAGGGEPLLNPATGEFIDRLTSHDVHTGVVTNGTRIIDYVDTLSQCTWVGVSVDAARDQTFNSLKGLPPESNAFQRVIDNIALLVDYAKMHNARLGFKHPAYGVSFKYLLYNSQNIGEIYQAARLAKEIGCKNIHLRPAGNTWDKMSTGQKSQFSKEDIELFQEQIAMSLELDDANFGVYGVTHKFDSQFEPANYFSKCYAIFMTAVFMPPSKDEAPEDSLVMGLCCDRRGDTKLELANDITDLDQLGKLWGGKAHWQIHDQIKVRNECPRCTYQPHNEIYEQVILNDSMTYKFI